MTQNTPYSALETLIAAELARPQPQAVLEAAQHIAKRHEGCVLGILFYGSCLRTGELDNNILDFHLVVSSYDQAYDSSWLKLANRLLPPNVFYNECMVDGRIIRSKYNIFSLEDIKRRVLPSSTNVSVWARFSQPMAFLLADSDETRQTITRHVSNAVLTMLGAALPLCDKGATSDHVWTRALGLTYGAELRSEPPGKGHEVYLLDAERYDALFGPALTRLGTPMADAGDGTLVLNRQQSAKDMKAAHRAWMWRRMNGKIVTFLRLIKASTTFDGGIDYLAWKIERHSGVKIEIKPWQRRFPVIAGLMHFIRLRRRGAFR